MLRKVKRIKLGKQIYRRLMKRVLERDGWRCRKGGSLENLQIHRKIKRSQQGNNSLGNLVPMCYVLTATWPSMGNLAMRKARRKSSRKPSIEDGVSTGPLCEPQPVRRSLRGQLVEIPWLFHASLPKPAFPSMTAASLIFVGIGCMLDG